MGLEDMGAFKWADKFWDWLDKMRKKRTNLFLSQIGEPEEDKVKEIVYCKECSHLIHSVVGHASCTAPENAKLVTYTRLNAEGQEWYQPPTYSTFEPIKHPKELNKNNDCPYFKKRHGSRVPF